MVLTLSKYETQLLDGWEEVYKRGQLTLWIMLALSDGPKYMADIKRYISLYTNDAVTADDQSMYRALRRYAEAEMVSYTNEPADKGPDRKVYTLTDTGIHVLKQFIVRNLHGLVRQPIVKALTEEQ
jgi:PadR family transcriptional regulator, regulatory protein PadR